MKLVVTIPAYNEEKTLGKVLDEIPKKISGIDKIEVLVVDDGSKDSTSKVAISKGAKVVKNSSNKGLAFTFSRALEMALDMDADIIVNTDADFQYDQRQIPAVIDPVLKGEADIVLGSRFKGKIEDMPMQKYWGNMAMSLMVSFLTGMNISDAQTGFRAFSRDAALKINVFSDYTYTQETILEAWEKKLVIKEVPVDFRKRTGKSRLISNVFIYAKKAGFTVVETYISYKPLRVFVTIGSLMCLLALAFGFRVIVHFYNTGLVTPYLPTAILSSMLLVVGVQVLIMGLVAEMIKRNRKIQEKILYTTRKNKSN
ncbi:MAG: glycosyl transferase family 2 [Candidatus Diapherotrites archaeon CG11_big_fil_rev_8_21_14_0_20_37_9]|nr:MAG: glycosyl transferase family 2 [Candidatus Diapherotrites archaeon CG11_big_fil_rev_8_21_14_0_20_37_9]